MRQPGIYCWPKGHEKDLRPTKHPDDEDCDNEISHLDFLVIIN